VRLARSIFPFPFPAHHARTHARTQSCHANPISRITTVLPIKKTHLSLLIDQYTHPLLHPGRLRLRLLRNTQLVRGSFDRGGVSSSSNVLSFLSPHTQQRVEWPTGAWVHPSSSPSSLAVGSQAAPRRPKRRRIASSHESGFALRAGAVAWRLVFVNTMHACMHVFGVGVGQAVLHSAVTYSWRRSNV
jgi:hypothetical protein